MALLRETAQTLRSLRKERTFTILSVLLLALGIGFASAVFTLLWQAIYAQLPVPAPGRIFTFKTNVTHAGRSDSDARATQTFSLPMYRYLAAHFKAPKGLIARHGEFLNLETPAGPQHALADFVTNNFFSVLEVQAVLGSLPGARADATGGDNRTAIISFDFWQQAYGGQPNPWNSILRVNGLPFRITGVAPARFRGLISGQAPKVYLPVEAFADVNPGWHGDRDWSLRWLNAFMRLPTNVSRAQAEVELQPVYRAAARLELASGRAQSPDYLKQLSHERMTLIPASQGAHAMLDDWQEPLRILQWMTAAMLLLAAVNVAGLMVVRALRQQREMLIRYALGATRGAVMRLQFLQTMALSLAGGLLGILFAQWGGQLLTHLAHMDSTSALVYRPHGWVLAVHWTAALVTGLFTGLFPACQAARLDLSAGLAGGLKDGALTHSAAGSQAFVRRLVAAAQIALSLVLAVAAGFFGQALHKLISVPVGFNPHHLTVFSIDAKRAGSNAANTAVIWKSIVRRLKETPGVEAVSYGAGGPFPQGADGAVVIPASDSGAIRKQQSGMRSIIGPPYFSTLGIPILSGREFDQRDRNNTPNVVILNRTLARKLFGQANPLGKTVMLFNGLDPDWLATIVGVIADHHQSWRRTNASLIYTPAQQARRMTDVTYFVRSQGPPLTAKTIQAIVHKEAPAISPYDVATMQTRMAEFASRESAMALLVAVFGALALTIAAASVYGVVSYSASLRTVEFAIRVSVGARPFDIVWLVLREAAWILAGGFCLAVPLAYFGLSLIRHQLVGISFREPGTYLAAVLLLTLCTLAAAILPARRAMRMDVHGALRNS